MDRTMYGKVDPGARQPFRCMVREKGILPGCKFIIFFKFATKPFFEELFKDQTLSYFRDREFLFSSQN